MDIKEQISKVVEKISEDESIRDEFLKDPVKAVEKVLGVDLPEEVIEKIVQGVKGKISLDKISGAVDSLKKLF